MKKRLIVLISCISLLFASLNISVYAKPVYNNDDKVELLYELGILDSKSEYKITLKSYLKMLANLSGVGDMDPLDFGTSMSMLKGSENGKNAVTVSDAVKYSVIALGYQFVAEQNGGNETAYNRLAAKLKLTDGITVGTKNSLTYTEAVKLIYNMLDVTPMVHSLGLENSYKEASNETMLSLKRKVYKISGIVTATPKTSIYKADGCLKDCVEIDMNLYSVKDGKNFDDFLGKHVEAYVSIENAGDECLLYMCGDNNKEVTVAAEDIISPVVDGIIKYDNGSKEKTIKCKFPPKVIVNGRFFSDYTDADFMPSIGSVKFIDNDDDGKSEVVIVENYREGIVISRNPFAKSLRYKKVLTDKEILAGEDETKELVIDDDIEFLIYKNGKEISISELNANDILLIKESKDKKAIIIEASDVKLEGKIQSWNSGTKELTIDGTDYAVTPAVIQKLQKKKISFEFGEKYKLYLNAFGDIADVEPASVIDYYLFFRAYVDELDETSCMVVYMDTNNEWHETIMCDYVIYDKVNTPNTSVVGSLTGKDPQIAKMKFNSRGDVKAIELSTLTKTKPTKEHYYSAHRTFNYNVYAEKGAIVLEMPEDITDKSLYKFSPIENVFRNDKESTYSAYDVDEYGFSKMFTMTLTKSTVPYPDDYFLVTRKNSVLANDIQTTELVGMLGRFSNFSYSTKDPDVANGVNEGDLIKIHINENGTIDFISSDVFHLYNKTKQWKEPKNDLIAGKIEAIDLDKGFVRLDFGSPTGSKTMLLVGTKSVIKYNVKRKDVRVSDFAELKVGDYIVMNTNTERKIGTMYCVE